MTDFNPQEDFSAVVDGFETVTLVRRGGATRTVVHALRRATTIAEGVIGSSSDVRRQVPSGGRLVAVDLAWHLSIAELPEAPQLGDAIVDGEGQRWTIVEVKRNALVARWRCAARNIAVAFGLDDTISVLKAAYVKNSCGAAEPIWRLWRSGVRARIQPIKTSVVADESTRGIAASYRIFVAEELDLDQTCRIRGSDGTLYTVKSASGAERLGELQTIEAEVSR
ncbi:MAG: hypothetical protein LLF97_01895 [Planctomycetaceae bacterium]|nr:hypothetical protein [Planctomycetaceae bacterium]